jgi:signal transduction histidine kinase
LVSVVVVGATLVIGAVGLVVLLHTRLMDSIDRTVVTRANDVAALVRNGTVPTDLNLGDDETVVQVVDDSGRIVASTRTVLEELPDVAQSDEAIVVDGVAVEVDDEDEEDDEGEDDEPEIDRTDVRVAAIAVEAPSGRYVVVAAEQREDAEETVAAVTKALLIAVPSLAALVALLTWTAAGRALRPVHRITENVSLITDKRLGTRVPVPNTDDEITHLATTMNAMLDRLQASSDRQRRFTADASHELRTPLTSLRAQVEVAALDPDAPSLNDVAPDLLAEITRLEQLITDLLALARVDSAVVPTDVVDVGALIAEDLNRPPRGGPIDLRLPAAPVLVDGSADQLRRAVRNLVDNAQRHTATDVAVTITDDGHHAVVEVRDDGPGIPAEERERVFERFTRLDAARATGDGGSGLGLAITRAIVEAHHGTIRLEPNHDAGHGTIALITLPRSGHRGDS